MTSEQQAPNTLATESRIKGPSLSYTGWYKGVDTLKTKVASEELYRLYSLGLHESDLTQLFTDGVPFINSSGGPIVGAVFEFTEAKQVTDWHYITLLCDLWMTQLSFPEANYLFYLGFDDMPSVMSVLHRQQLWFYYFDFDVVFGRVRDMLGSPVYPQPQDDYERGLKEKSALYIRK